MTQHIDIVVDQGGNNLIEYQWLDSLTNLPVDLGQYKARMQIKITPDANPCTFELSTMLGNITFDAPQGIIKVTFKPYDFPAPYAYIQNYWYDLFLTRFDDNFTLRFARGFLTLIGQVTDTPANFLYATGTCTATFRGVLL